MRYFLNFLFFISCFILSKCISVSKNIDYNEGKNNIWIYYTIIVVSLIGILLNGLCLHLFISIKNKKAFPQFPLIFALNWIGFLYSLFETIIFSIDLHYLTFVGGDTAAAVDGFLNMFFTCFSLIILVGIAFTTERHLCTGHHFNDLESILLIIFCGLYSASIAALAIWLPYGGFQLQTSGTWTFINVNKPVCLVMIFFFASFIPQAFMMDRMNRAFKAIKTAQQQLKDKGITAQAKPKYVQMVINLHIFMASNLLCIIPVLGSSISQWVTGQHPPFYVDVISGGFVFLNSCIINPALFFYLNYEMQDAFWLKYGQKFTSFIEICFQSNQAKIGAIEDINEFKDKLRDVNFWLNDDDILIAGLSKYCEANYSYENVSFLLDAIKYQNLGKELLIALKPAPKFQSKITSPSARKFLTESSNNLNKIVSLINLRGKTTDIISSNTLITTMNSEDMWIKLYSKIVCIYELYIQIPNAPLEINISTSTHEKILKILKIESVNSTIIPEFEDLSVISKESLENILNVLNEAMNSINRMLVSDIFPRFQKSVVYHKTIEKYNENLTL